MGVRTGGQKENQPPTEGAPRHNVEPSARSQEASSMVLPNFSTPLLTHQLEIQI